MNPVGASNTVARHSLPGPLAPMRASALAICLLAPLVVTSCTHLRGRAPSSPTALHESSPKIRLLNTKIFGHSADDAVVLLQPNDGSKVDPEYVLTDIKGGRYYAATVAYPTTLIVDAVRASINEVYGKYELRDLDGVWRNTDEQFTIGLNTDADGIHVMYITFQPAQEVFKNMLKAGVFGPFSDRPGEPSQ